MAARGGGLNCYDAHPTATNCILWGNSAPLGAAIRLTGDAEMTIAYSDVEGGQEGIPVGEDCELRWGAGNIDLDPQFVDADGPDDDPNTWEDNDYRVEVDSPCIDVANNRELPADTADLDGDGNIVEHIPMDRDGSLRIYNCVTDMGAYEWPYQPGTYPDCNGNGIPDDCEEDCNENGVPDDCDIADGTSEDVNGNGVPDECEIVGYWYVDDDAPGDPGPGDPTVSDPDENGSIFHPFDSIWEGIQAAQDTDVVWVADGTYTGSGNKNLPLLGKAIAIRSENGPAHCIIDCEGSGRAFWFHDDETADTILDGLTITNGVGPATGGGGIHMRYANPTVRNCAIVGNYCEDSGGGVRCYWASPRFINCTIASNSTSEQGGGVSCLYGSARLINCLICGNSATGDGGGIRDWGNMRLVNCAIIANVSDANGGGVSSGGLNHPSITDCTLVGNTAIGIGGGVCCDLHGEATISNSVFRDNAASQGPEIALCYSYAELAVLYSNIEGGEDGVFVQAGTLIWGQGNVDADPLFVDPDGPDDDPNTWQDNNCRLSAGSPCIDAADNTAVPADIADLDADGDVTERTPLDLAGMLRFRDDPDTEDTGVPDPPDYPEIVDMGAYEFHLAGDLDGDGDIDADDFHLFVAAFGQCVGELGYRAEADLDGDGCVTLVDYQLWMQLYRDFVGDPAASAPGLGIPGDLNGDGCIDLSDLAMLLANYGTTSGATFADGDSNGDGDVDLSDLSALLAVYGPTCP